MITSSWASVAALRLTGPGPGPPAAAGPGGRSHRDSGWQRHRLQVEPPSHWQAERRGAPAEDRISCRRISESAEARPGGGGLLTMKDNLKLLLWPNLRYRAAVSERLD